MITTMPGMKPDLSLLTEKILNILCMTLINAANHFNMDEEKGKQTTNIK